jgi:hypothetical protein
MLLPKWSSYLSCHPDIPALEASRAGVIASLEASSLPLTPEETASRMMTLKSSPSSIILTLSPVDYSITATHHHDSLGLSVNGSLRCIALTGMHSQAHPVILAMGHLFSSTEDTHCTPLYDVMLETADKPISHLKGLQPFEGVRSHIPKAVLLPPCLYPLALDRTWSSAHELLHAAIKLIAALLPPPPPTPTPDINDEAVVDEIEDPDTNDDPVPPPNETQDDAVAADPAENMRDWTPLREFEPILQTLWGFTDPALRQLLTTAHSSASTPDALTWSHQQHLLLSPRRDATINITSISDETSTVVSALDKLTDKLSSAKSQHFASAPEQQSQHQQTPNSSPNKQTSTHTPSSTDDNNNKQWLKIDPTFRQGILNASCKDEDDVPSLPTHRLLHITQTKSGSTAARLFARWHPNLDMLVQPGMATNIVKGMLTSAPNPSSINTFSPFFTQPTRAGFKNFTNDEMNELELSTQTLNLSATDIQKLIRCEPYIPYLPNIFISQVENFDSILSDILSPECQIRQLTTSPLIKHFKQNEQVYYQIFQDHKHFGVWLMNRLHFKTQSILHQCYRFDNAQDIQFDRFSIFDELDSIDTLSFSADPPQWYLSQLNKLETPNNRNNNNSNRKRQNTHSNDDSNNSRIKVFNNNRDSRVRLQPDEKYSSLVYFKNLENCEDSAVKIDGEYICNNWHVRGHCVDSCKRKHTHIKLPTELERKYRIYIQNLRDSQSRFKTSHRGNRGNMKERNGGSNRSGENN